MIYEDLTYVARLLKRYRVGGFGHLQAAFVSKTQMVTQLLPRDFDRDNGLPAALVQPAERRASLARDPSDGSYTKG